MAEDRERNRDGPLLLCRKAPREDGAAFTAWTEEYLDAAEGKGDEDASWAECYLGTDPQVGLTPQQTRRRARRRKESYAGLMAHLPEGDETLKSTVRSEANRNGRQAWIVLCREKGERDSALAVNRKIQRYHGLSIAKNIGSRPSTIKDFNGLITQENNRLPAANQFDADSMTEKLIGAITFPATLASKADDLLQSPKAALDARFYTQPVAAAMGIAAVPGGWVRNEIVKYFDELWRSA